MNKLPKFPNALNVRALWMLKNFGLVTLEDFTARFSSYEEFKEYCWGLSESMPFNFIQYEDDVSEFLACNAEFAHEVAGAFLDKDGFPDKKKVANYLVYIDLCDMAEMAISFEEFLEFANSFER